MRAHVVRGLVAALFLGACIPLIGVNEGSLTVRVKGIHTGATRVVVDVSGDLDDSASVAADGAAVEVRFELLPAGDYKVIVTSEDSGGDILQRSVRDGVEVKAGERLAIEIDLGGSEPDGGWDIGGYEYDIGWNERSDASRSDAEYDSGRGDSSRDAGQNDSGRDAGQDASSRDAGQDASSRDAGPLGPALCLPVDRLAFETAPGNTVCRELTILSCGTASVTGLAVSVDGSGAASFTVPVAPGSVLLAGASADLSVCFSPGAVGAVEASLVVGSSAGDRRVALSGHGVDREAITCGSARTFEPQLKWRTRPSGDFDSFDQVWVTPLVANLTDDNGDSQIDDHDVPDVVYLSFDRAEFNANLSVIDHTNDPMRAVLRAADGATGSEHWAAGGEGLWLDSAVIPAIADIDGDGLPEIVAGLWREVQGVSCMPQFPDLPALCDKFTSGQLVAFEHDGSLKWRSEAWQGAEGDMENSGAVAVADLDHDGRVEILFGASILDDDGRLRWHGGQGRANYGHGPHSFAVNLDLQGDLELVAGNTAYRADGTVLWHREDLSDGLPAVADLDGDGRPEVVLNNSALYVLAGASGEILAGPLLIPQRSEESHLLSIPTLADFDGDGLPEIAISSDKLSVMEMDGVHLWSEDIDDVTGMATPAAFDLEGDGVYEVVMADELHLRVFRGSDGTLVFDTLRRSLTLAESATVADIDGDGRAEILVAENEPESGTAGGVTAYQAVGEPWIGTLPIYSQHAFHVTDVSTTAQVPASWPVYWNLGSAYNGFHLNLVRCTP